MSERVAELSAVDRLLLEKRTKMKVPGHEGIRVWMSV